MSATTNKDLYAVLGVPPHAGVTEIRERFRQMAKLYHPDVAPSQTDRFREIREAYAILVSSDERRAYDSRRSSVATGERFSGEVTPDADTGSASHGAWFGEESRGTRASVSHSEQPASERAAKTESRASGYGDLETEILVTLGEVLNGARRVINLRRMGTTETPRQLSIDIPKGVGDGQTIRLPGMGRASLSRGESGDLTVVVRYAPHPHYQVQGRDLVYQLVLHPWQMVLGDVVQVPSIDASLPLRITAGSFPGKRVRVREEGLPKESGGRGDLVVQLGVDFPSILTAAEKAAWEQVRAAMDRNSPAGD